ncbi:hypothetical protein [Paenibacillus sp. L3-i20]|uniref:hypothetical protein n=1 Tax=Paenibacillus sp. L3-i20 TaxID=2905833 RepID=UPI001EE10BF3|nr:hypothetical protein [Paenibacillus sp. L3-i20]GKU78127.1 hypothetical protein L3i20_v225240 [Paenibacillus sp. L3-i20]
MNIGFVGDCDKVDVALMAGLLLKSYHADSPVTIVADRHRHYQYFKDEVSGMAVQLEEDSHSVEGTVIYDWHSMELPRNRLDKLYAVTTYDKPSLEFACEFVKRHEVQGVVVLESDCSITPKYIRYLFPDVKTLSCFDDPRRRMDWVFDGRVSTRKLGDDFTSVIGELAQDISGITPVDLKKMWIYLKKRSA